MNCRTPAEDLQAFTFLNQRLDEFLSVLGDRRLQVFQLAPGLFEGDSTVLVAPGCRMVRCCSTQPLLLSWTHDAEILLAFPLHERPLFCLGRRWMHEQQLAVLEGTTVVMRTPERNAMLLIMVSVERLHEQLGATDASRFLQAALALQQGRVRVLDKAAVTARVMELFHRLCNCSRQDRGQGCGELLGQLLAALYGYITSAQHDDPPALPGNHERVVQLVLARVLIDPTAELTLDGLCQAAFCSRRTLASAFEELCSVSPVKLVRMVRLNAFRRELLRSGKVDELSILIANWGYSNAGRLNKEYRQLFGQRPRETLLQHGRLLKVHAPARRESADPTMPGTHTGLFRRT